MTKTQTRIEIIEDIKPRVVYSAYIPAPFDEAKEALEADNYRIISLEDNARLRIQEGKDKDVSIHGNFVREGSIYVPQKGSFMTKASPVMKNAQKATDAHRNGDHYFLSNDQVEEALTDAIEMSQKSIPTNRFADDEITRYAFGETAEAYGRFLKEAGIKEMPVWPLNPNDKAIATQMWFGDLDDGSDLDGDDSYLDCNCRVRGVRQSGAEGTQKNLESKVSQ